MIASVSTSTSSTVTSSSSSQLPVVRSEHVKSVFDNINTFELCFISQLLEVQFNHVTIYFQITQSEESKYERERFFYILHTT